MMRSRLVLNILVILFFGCIEREYPQPFPIVFTKNIENITVDGVEFVGSAESLGSNQEIISYGFAWGEMEKPTINSSYTTISDNIKVGSFSKVVNNDLEEDVLYYVRAFIQTESLIVYGNIESFTSKGSKAPLITEFSPEKGVDGAEITIKGNYFSNKPERNHVKIGNLTAKVTSSTETEIKATSPVSELIGDFDLSVTVAGKTAKASKKYAILGPRIRSTSKSSGRVGDFLIVNGEYFSEDNFLSLYFGSPIQYEPTNYSTTFINSATEMMCYVPDYPNRTVNMELYSYSPNFGTLQKNMLHQNPLR
jgi:hypothetical protein